MTKREWYKFDNSWWLEGDNSPLMISLINSENPQHYVILDSNVLALTPLSTHESLDAAKVAYLMLRSKYGG